METERGLTNWYSVSDQTVVTELGKNLRQIRLNQNLTQEKLAAKAGLSRSAIYEMENGKSATSLFTIVQVLRALQQLQVFDSWKTEKQKIALRMTTSIKKVRIRSTQKSIQLKKEENEWEWL